MGKKVLLIDDIQTYRKNILLFMKEDLSGYVVTEKMDYASAINSIQSEEFNIIILDIQLPKGKCDLENYREDSRYGLDILDFLLKALPNQNVICYSILAENHKNDYTQSNIVWLSKLENNADGKLMSLIKKYW